MLRVLQRGQTGFPVKDRLGEETFDPQAQVQ